MRVLLILPALAEAGSPEWRPVKYALFPPLGLAALAAHLDDADDVRLVDCHVERLDLDDRAGGDRAGDDRAGGDWSGDDRPDLVVIQVYITNAYRAYALADHFRAKGSHVALGGLHVTALPEEAARHADTIFLGPGDQTFPQFLADLRAGRPGARYASGGGRTLDGVPPPRRDLIRRGRYLVPNSLVVSRGCPRHCDFCYKDAFFTGGRGFYTERVDAVLAEIDRLPGRHLYFLDDHLFGDARFARELFAAMRGMGRVFQGAATVDSVLRGDLLDRAVEAGLRSLFVGFETFSEANLRASNKSSNLARDYAAVARRLSAAGVMVNGSFVFGMDDDGPDVFDRTVAWAIGNGLTTCTFHIQTPYPGTRLHADLAAQGRITSDHWDEYDTRHVVYRPARLTPEQLLAGYHRAYRDVYTWRGIARAAAVHDDLAHRARHLAYGVGWKKAEPLWGLVVRAHRLARLTPVLEQVLGPRGRSRSGTPDNHPDGVLSPAAPDVVTLTP